MKVEHNFNIKSKQIKKYAKKLHKDILRDAVAVALQEVANVSAMSFFKQTRSKLAARTLAPEPDIVTSRTGRLIASILGDFRFNDVRLPNTVRGILTDETKVTPTNEFAQGKTESIRQINVSGSTIQGWIGSSTPYAAKHEYGQGNTSARPYLRPAVKVAQRDIIEIFRESITGTFKEAKI